MVVTTDFCGVLSLSVVTEIRHCAFPWMALQHDPMLYPGHADDCRCSVGACILQPRQWQTRNSPCDDIEFWPPSYRLKVGDDQIDVPVATADDPWTHNNVTLAPLQLNT